MTFLRERGTWALEPYPKRNIQILPNNFIFKKERNADASLEKYKARAVYLGCNQKKNSYEKLCSTVLGFTIVRIELSIAGALNAYVHQMEVSSAFLHGHLHEEFYMHHPK